MAKIRYIFDDLSYYSTLKLSSDRSAVRKLSMLSSRKSMGTIAFEWILIAGAIMIHQLYAHPAVYLLTWVIIGTRLYALYSLSHDGIHYLLVKDKTVNDMITTVFLAFPIFISVRHMRKSHFDHHKYLQTAADPEIGHLAYREFQFPKSKSELFLILLLDITGVNFLYYKVLRFKRLLAAHGGPSEVDWGLAVNRLAYVVLFGVMIYLGLARELLLYWIVPYITLYQVLNRIRLSTEHFNLDGENEMNTRTVVPTMAERFLLAPHNLSYHREHHLFPGVPFYNLPMLHQALLDQRDSADRPVLETNYLQVLKKCIK